MTTEVKKPSGGISPTIRNMIIGVSTAILVSTAVYLLGFNKKSGSSKLERQKATTEAWKSYVTIENIYTKAATLLLRDATQFSSYKELYEESLKESAKFLSSIEELLKIKDLDKDMEAVLKRRIQNEKTSMPRAERFFNQLDELNQQAINKDWTEKQFTEAQTAIITKFQEQTKGVYDRSITDIEDLAKTLSDRYDQTFSIDEFLIIQAFKYKKDLLTLIDDTKTDSTTARALTKEYIIGKWRLDQALLTFDADGNWVWKAPNMSDAKGTSWEVKNGQLIMDVTEHPKKPAGEDWKWSFNLSNVMENSFSMQLPEEGSFFYTLIRQQ
jgi:hypothetical protein